MGNCFVIMGFGDKTDFASTPQRVLSMNKTYDNIIKPAVEETGHTCIRADEIIHSTVIDKPMYDNLLSADLVIADLSTSNANAIYELGVRHALRPRRTIVMAENSFSFPFDLNHLSILKYEHLGKDIGFSEVMRVKQALKTKITTLMDSPEVDSPVFLFIPSLQAPKLLNLPAAAAALPAPSSIATDRTSFAELLASYRAEKNQVSEAADWAVPLGLLNRLKKMQPDDSYILQQLALATYKFEQPDRKAALVKAQGILGVLAPRASSDAETVGLWGAIHKRLWDQTRDRNDLDEAVKAYGRGYYIRNDHYNGISYAFVLDLRASQSEGDEAVADRVLARRVRKDVLLICERLLQAIPAAGPQTDSDEPFWIGASKVEALFGLGRTAEALALKDVIVAQERQRLGGDNDQLRWKERTLVEQLDRLAKLLPP
jgi:Tetratricopeptide Repeats-Sensor